MKKAIRKAVKTKKGIRMIDVAKVTPKNKEMIKEFMNWIKGHVCDKRYYNYNLYLHKFADLVECDFEKIDKEKMRKVSALINESDYSKHTINMMITSIKSAFKHWFGEDEYFPPILNSLKRKKIKGPKQERKIFTEEDIFDMLKLIDNPMWLFFLSFIGLDAGARACELRSLRWKDLDKDDYSYYFWIKTAKESGNVELRPIRIIKSMPYFLKWKKTLKLKNTTKAKTNNSNEYVFLDQFGKPLSEDAVCMFFSRLRKLTGYKELTSLSMRRSFISRKQKDTRITTAQLQKHIGHVVGGKTIASYTFLNDDDTLDAQLLMSGIKKFDTEKIKDHLPKICKNCKKENEHNAEFCYKCHTPLIEEAFIQVNKDLNKRMGQMEKAMFLMSKNIAEMIKNNDLDGLKKIICKDK